MSGVLFEDIFEVGKLNPDGKKFDRGKREWETAVRSAGERGMLLSLLVDRRWGGPPAMLHWYLVYSDSKTHTRDPSSAAVFFCSLHT